MFPSSKFGIFSPEDLQEFEHGKNIEKCLLRSWVYTVYHMFQAFSKHFTFATNDQQKWIAVFGESGKIIRDFDRRCNPFKQKLIVLLKRQ